MDPFQSFSDTFKTLAGGHVKRTRRPGEVFEEYNQVKFRRILASRTVLAIAVVLALLLLTLSASAQGVNQPPVALPDIYATALDTQVDLLPGLVANDSDPDSDPVSLVSFAQPDSGSIVDNGGVLTYTPNAGFEGLDSFTYTITDGTDNSTGRAFIEVGSPATDLFEINIGDSVSNGVPGAGAGNIEIPGAEDVYLFQAVAGQSIILNWLSGSNALIGWSLQAPDDSVLFDTRLQDHQEVLPENGTYTLTVYGLLSTSTGLYSFDLLSVPPSEAFTINIGDTVSNGVPAPGAGNLEAPGAIDVYTFDGIAGQEVIFDWLSGSNVLIGWQLGAPNGTMLFDSVLADYQMLLPQTGSYMLTVSGNGIDDFGLYSFRLLAVGTLQVFNISIGDTVSDGVPEPGAGNIEGPGAVDVYHFDGIAGQEVIFDWLSGANVILGWQLDAPDGTILFDSVLADYQEILPQTGTYTLTLSGNGIDDFGLYSFQLLNVPPDPQQFAISLGDTVSNGIPLPGAGNLEVPGAVDVYTFDAVAGQEVIFDYLSGSNVMIGWRLDAPDSTVLFDSVLADYQLILPQTGTYTLTVRGNGFDNFGLYSFLLSEMIVPTDTPTPTATPTSTPTEAPQVADLSVTKVDNPDPVNVGTDLSYSIQVVNHGPDNAQAVVLSDALPGGTTYVSSTAPAGWSCTTPSPGQSGVVTCSNPSIAPGTYDFTLTIHVPAAYDGSNPIVNNATVVSLNDPDNTNDTSSASTGVNFSSTTPTPSGNVSLVASAECIEPNIEVTITSGDGPFTITGQYGDHLPVFGAGVGTTVIAGPDAIADITVTETTGDFESIIVGGLICRPAEIPLPLTPANGSSTSNPVPTFTWNGIPNANQYSVVLSDASRNITRNFTVGPATSLTWPAALAQGQYYWRVSGVVNNVWSYWSVIFTLTITPPSIASQPLSPVNVGGMLTYESSNVLVRQSGNWTSVAASNASGEQYLLSSGSSDDALFLTSQGNRVAVLYVNRPGAGNLIIEVDGRIAGSVSTAGPDAYGNILLVENLGNSTHNIRIYGQNGPVAIDAVIIESGRVTGPDSRNLPRNPGPVGNRGSQPTAVPTIDLNPTPDLATPVPVPTFPTPPNAR